MAAYNIKFNVKLNSNLPNDVEDFCILLEFLIYLTILHY